MPPETLFGYGYGVASEWWTLGCLIYEMLTGNPPFRLQEERLGKQNAREQLYNEIKFAEPNLNLPFLSYECRDLLSQLLNKNPRKRPTFKKIMKHPWFSSIKSWDSLLAKEVPPPFIPKLENALDLRYFDPSFT